MRRSTLALIVTGALIVASTTMVAVAAGTRSIEVLWQPPARYAGPGSDCARQGNQLSSEDVSALSYQVRWRLSTSEEYEYATTTSTRYIIEAVPVGQTVSVSVGAFLPGGSVACWTEEVSVVVPPQPVGGCRNVRVTVQ